MKVILKHYESGHEIKVKKGFSWTTLFFGFFVPLLRGDFKWAVIMFIVNVLISVITVGIGLFFVNIIFAFIYNSRYINDLGKRGYIDNREVPRNAFNPNNYNVKS